MILENASDWRWDISNKMQTLKVLAKSHRAVKVKETFRVFICILNGRF